MHKRYIVKLDKEERKQLAELVKKEKVAAKKRTHTQVLLLADCDRNGPAWKDEAIAEACRVTVRTVENLRDTPTSISVLNRELMDDLGIATVNEIAAFAVAGEHSDNTEGPNAQ